MKILSDGVQPRVDHELDQKMCCSLCSCTYAITAGDKYTLLKGIEHEASWDGLGWYTLKTQCPLCHTDNVLTYNPWRQARRRKQTRDVPFSILIITLFVVSFVVWFVFFT